MRVRDAADRRPIVSTRTLRLWCPSSSLILTLFFDLTLVLSFSVCQTFFLSADFRSLSSCLPDFLSVCRLSFSLFLSAPWMRFLPLLWLAPGFVSGGSLLIGRPFFPPNSTFDPRAGDSEPRGFAVRYSADS